MIPFLLFGISSATGVIPPVSVDTGGGAGHPVGIYYQHKKKTRYETLKRNAIDELLDKSLSEVYSELTDDDEAQETRKEAAQIVKPFVEKRTKQKIPPVARIDFRALKQDEELASRLLVLWYEKIGKLRDEEQRRLNDDYEEELILIMAAMM